MRCSFVKTGSENDNFRRVSHLSSGPDGGRRVSLSSNPVGIMTDLQRRLMAGKSGLLELALLRESHRILVEEAKKRLDDQTRKATEIMENEKGRRSRVSNCRLGFGGFGYRRFRSWQTRSDLTI